MYITMFQSSNFKVDFKVWNILPVTSCSSIFVTILPIRSDNDSPWSRLLWLCCIIVLEGLSYSACAFPCFVHLYLPIRQLGRFFLSINFQLSYRLIWSPLSTSFTQLTFIYISPPFSFLLPTPSSVPRLNPVLLSFPLSSCVPFIFQLLLSSEAVYSKYTERW